MHGLYGKSWAKRSPRLHASSATETDKHPRLGELWNGQRQQLTRASLPRTCLGKLLRARRTWFDDPTSQRHVCTMIYMRFINRDRTETHHRARLHVLRSACEYTVNTYSINSTSSLTRLSIPCGFRSYNIVQTRKYCNDKCVFWFYTVVCDVCDKIIFYSDIWSFVTIKKPPLMLYISAFEVISIIYNDKSRILHFICMRWF